MTSDGTVELDYIDFNKLFEWAKNGWYMMSKIGKPESGYVRNCNGVPALKPGGICQKYCNGCKNFPIDVYDDLVPFSDRNKIYRVID